MALVVLWKCRELFDQGDVMRIQLASVMVDDQDKALKFYTKSWAS